MGNGTEGRVKTGEISGSLTLEDFLPSATLLGWISADISPNPIWIVLED